MPRLNGVNCRRSPDHARLIRESPPSHMARRCARADKRFILHAPVHVVFDSGLVEDGALGVWKS